MSEPQQIYDDPLVTALYAPKTGQTLFISFNAGGDYKGGLSFPGDRFLSQQGWSALGIVDKTRAWFPKVAMAPLLQKARDLIQAKGYQQVVTWGVGMGGYGALRFAAALGAARTFAFAPQSSIDPAHTGFGNTHWSNIEPQLRDDMLVEAQHLAPASLIIYDPLEPQARWYGDYLMRYPGVNRVLFPLAGRNPLQALAETRQQRAFFDLLLVGEAAAARCLLRAERRRSTQYWLGCAKALEGRPSAQGAYEAAQRAVAVGPLSAPAAATAARLALQQGETAETVAARLRASPLMAGRRPDHQKALLHQLTLAGQTAVIQCLAAAGPAADLTVSPLARAAILVRSGDVAAALPLLAAIDGQPIKQDQREYTELIDALLTIGKAEEVLPLLLGLIAAAPQDLALHLRYARALHAAGRIVEAKRAAEAADALDHLSVPDMRSLMKLHQDLATPHRLERLAKLILEEQPNSLETRRELIVSIIHRQDLVSARTEIEAAAATSVSSSDLLIIIALYERVIATFAKIHPHRKHLQVPEVPDLVRILFFAQKAVALTPDSLRARLALTLAHIQLNQKAEAATQLDYVLSNLSPTDAEHWVQIARFLSVTGRRDHALSIIQRAEKAPRWSDAVRLDVGRFFVGEGERSKAEAVLAAANLDAIPSINLLSAYHDLFVELERMDLAASAVRLALKRDPFNPGMKQREAALTLIHKRPTPISTLASLPAGSSRPAVPPALAELPARRRTRALGFWVGRGILSPASAICFAVLVVLLGVEIHLQSNIYVIKHNHDQATLILTRMFLVGFVVAAIVTAFISAARSHSADGS